MDAGPPVQPLPLQAVDSEPIDSEAVERIMGLLLERYSSDARLRREASAMLAKLNQPTATDYEVGLVTLSTLLGAESFNHRGRVVPTRPGCGSPGGSPSRPRVSSRHLAC